MVKKRLGRKGQVTVFVIIAIVIIAAVATYFIIKANTAPNKTSSNFEPIENSFLNCIQQKAQNGIKILETKGGYIVDPSFIPGSTYMPYSSQLDFLGIGIPYWRSISGNNLPINQVPTKDQMQTQLSNYLESQIADCNFNSFTAQGFKVNEGTPRVQTTINDNNVVVNLNMDLSMSKGNESDVVTNHQVQVDSTIGSLYNDAVKFYNLENQDMFLENYSVDILRTYAPVDGFVLSCSPQTWNANQIFSTLKNATEANFAAMKNSGNSTDYFNLKLPLSSSVRILNSASWPSDYEVSPADSPVLVAKPVGTQTGLGILGFCYVTYHFVYTVRYPLLVQLTQNGETFQFPLAINIENNVAKDTSTPLNISNSAPSINLCTQGSTSNVTVNLVGPDGNPVEGNVSYNCLGSSCQIGQTTNGKINGTVPQCVNGQVIVDSSGYVEASKTFSSVDGGSITIPMKKIYQKTVIVNLTNSQGNEKSIITFNSVDSPESGTIIYPDQNQINLTEGNYNITVYTYDNSSISFNATTTQQCTEVPSGILGIIGITHQECTDIPIPAQNITSVVVAGGNANVYFNATNLTKNNKIEIDLDRYKTPTNLQELQIIYTLVDAKNVGVKFV